MTRKTQTFKSTYVPPRFNCTDRLYRVNLDIKLHEFVYRIIKEDETREVRSRWFTKNHKK